MALRAAGQGTRWRQVLSQWQTRRPRLVRNRNDWTEQSGTGDSTTLKPSFRKQLQHEGTKDPKDTKPLPAPGAFRGAGNRASLRLPATIIGSNTTHLCGMLSSDNTKALALDLSHEVIGAAIEVHRWVGPGLLESVYEAALCRELILRKIQVTRQQKLPVSYKGQSLDCHLRLDLLVEGILIVEVKSLE